MVSVLVTESDSDLVYYLIASQPVKKSMRRHKGAAKPRFHTHVYTHGSRHRPHSGLPRPPIKGRLLVLCNADRPATGLFLVPFLSAASIPRGLVPSDPLNHHVEVGTTQECVRVRRPRAVAIPPTEDWSAGTSEEGTDAVNLGKFSSSTSTG